MDLELEPLFEELTKSFILSQSDDPTPPESYDNMTSYELSQMKFDAFAKGMDADMFAANFTNCGDMYLELSYIQWPVYSIKLGYADFGDYYFNTTLIAMNTSDTLYYCTDTV